MAVLVEALSVVVRRQAIDSVFPGGWAGFVRFVPNRTLCADGELARVGFMSPEDAKRFVDLLEGRGLRFLAEAGAEDLAVVDQLRGPTCRASWLEFGSIELKPGQKVAACRLAGSEEEHIACPEGWTYESSLSNRFTYVPGDTADGGRLQFRRSDGGVDVYWDPDQKREVYMGRTGGGATVPETARAPSRPPATPARVPPAANAQTQSRLSSRETLRDILLDSYRPRAAEGTQCSRCGDTQGPFSFHVLEFSADLDRVPEKGVVMAKSDVGERAGARGSFPLCTRCVPVCRKCGLPVPTERVLEFGFTLKRSLPGVFVASGRGVCEHIRWGLFLVALVKRALGLGRFRRD